MSIAYANAVALLPVMSVAELEAAWDNIFALEGAGVEEAQLLVDIGAELARR